MNIRSAKLCIDCDEIFSGDACPKCGGDNWRWIVSWIPAIGAVRRGPAPGMVAGGNQHAQEAEGAA